ncbi:ME53 [Spodoptera frugiperda multiple nucleopolyhedrovirus]|uniref:ME53 n=1 Tax=Spodoptera frugiperda nuclear polyhedrosis virus TaxID=10455 RepID=A1YJ00_NPVSF|nr:ME53 [Spodoptera frugiperda multiple nucleopolyhedrovirus]ABM45721.1 ME53 [Spodoptera frugiperda multiple nucleopolyhedrovirus]QED39923.1 ME53 [Spodoptera frugiperda multiple nucleopolyhedrovirus]
MKKFMYNKGGKNTTVSAKVNTNLSPDEKPKDLRGRFLSNQNYRLMKSVLRFSSEYVQGVRRVNDLVEMKCDDTKCKEITTNAKCQGECGKIFNNGKFLFCVYDTSAAAATASSSGEAKFKLVCNLCSNDYSYNNRYEVLQLFPTVSQQVVERLCEIGFLTKYIFPIKLNYTETQTKTEVINYHDFYKMVKSIIKEKKSNEQITEIKLSTYGRDLFVETDDFCVMRKDSNEFNETVYELDFFPKQSSMLEFLKIYKDNKPLTYFYTVKKRVYLSIFDYAVYFPFKCVLFCKVCTKNKMYLKTHPVLYCSKCGFTDPMFFNNSAFLESTIFLAKCVKYKTMPVARIFYYDMTLYKTFIKKPFVKK